MTETLQQKIDKIFDNGFGDIDHTHEYYAINTALQEFREQIIRERLLDIESKKASANTVLYDFRIQAYNKVLALLGTKDNL